MHVEHVLCEIDAHDGILFMEALSFSLCFDTASLAHCDAVRGERLHPISKAFEEPRGRERATVAAGFDIDRDADEWRVAQTVIDGADRSHALFA